MAETVTRKTIREEVADHLGLLMHAVVDAKVDADTITVNKLADLSPDPERIRDAWVFHPNVTNETNWRRILHFGYPDDNDVDVSRAFSPEPSATDPIQIYFMLTPEDWNAITNETLRKFYFLDQDAVAIVADQRDYNLSTWIQTKGQVLNVYYRNTTTGVREPLVEYALEEDANLVKLQLTQNPPSTSDYEIIVEARHDYSALTTDVLTTTCPRALWFHGVAVGGLQRIFKKYGANIKRLYGQAVVLEERDLAAAKASILPPLVVRHIPIDFAWTGPDVDTFMEQMSW